MNRYVLTFIALAFLALVPLFAADPEPDCCPCSTNYCNYENCDCHYSPLFVFTEEWRGALTDPDGGICFDLIPDDEGCEQVSWPVDPGAGGLLALPQDGYVTSYLQIFSEATPQPGADWTAWGALAAWDEEENGGNADGVIDSQDEVFDGLALWTDYNRDGVGTPDEMHYLSPGDWIALSPRDFVHADGSGNIFQDRSRGVILGSRDFVWDVYLRFESR